MKLALALMIGFSRLAMARAIDLALAPRGAYAKAGACGAIGPESFRPVQAKTETEEQGSGDPQAAGHFGHR
jgi:hypothetical protein